MSHRKLRSEARSSHGITWGIVRGHKIHLGCATDEELTLTWGGWHGADHPDGYQQCERCQFKLSETPDP